MRRVWSLVALCTLALGVSGVPARAAFIESDGLQARALSQVTAVSVVPGSGRAEVVIAVQGQVSVRDFAIVNPHRIVLDISGARMGGPGPRYDGSVRAGIANVRMAQYNPEIVRVVLDVRGAQNYTVQRGTNEIRVMIPSSEQFAAWHSSGSRVAVASSAPAPQPTVTPERPPNPAPERPVNPAPERQPNADSMRADSIAQERARADAMARDRAESDRAERERVAREIAARERAERERASAGLVDAAIAPTLQVRQRPQAQRITVTYNEADIRAVLAAFAGFSGRTIVVGKDVQGTVSAEIKDQPWDVALQAILTAQGLAATEDPSGIITVDSYQNILQKQASEPLTTQIIKINYSKAAQLVPTIQGLLSKDCPQGAMQTANTNPQQQAMLQSAPQCVTRGNVSADSATNSLIVTEVTSRLNSILSYVRELDVRTPQVALNARVLSLNRTSIELLGVSYDFGSRGTFFNTLLPRIPEGSTQPLNFESQVTVDGQSFAGVGNARRRFSQTGALNLLFSTAIGGFSISSFLDALTEQQLLEIQAEPSIVTLDNREARIFVGQETPVRVIDAGSVGQIGQPVRANVQFKEAGILLRVTPHITNNRQIQMTLEAEQSDLTVVGGELGFVINKRNARSQLLVNNSETAVIGGLTQNQHQKVKAGIPLLMNLPLIGRFFSQTDDRTEKRDLLIMITPTIIDEGQPVRPRGLEPR
ncbi:MAG TPA: AMIN domain-containing protein [Gemmatimonadaceae bacterium]|nr:AMIN domain-containing protein [Gemmatimonadaceae bacterium]